MNGIGFEQLLAYRDQETSRWHDFFVKHPQALAVPCDVARQKTVAGLVHHIFAVERLHTERLLEAPTTPFEFDPPATLEALYAVAADARAKIGKFLQSASEPELDKILTFTTRTAANLSTSKRKLMTHVLLHGARHWAQLAMLLRQAGYAQDWLHDFLFLEAMQ